MESNRTSNLPAHSTRRATCQVTHLGTVEYLHAWDLQLRLAEGVRSGQIPSTLLLLEHPPVYTRGRLGDPADILLCAQELEARSIQVIETDRGGQITYHGPGQIVIYPVVNLRDWGGPLKYIRTLEQVIVKTLADFEIKAHLLEGITGVWVDNAKISAIGVKISRGVAFHGLCINVNTDLSYYDHIIPCGIEDKPVTSMANVLGEPVDEELVRYSLTYQFGCGMGFNMVEADSASMTGIPAPSG